ncbi:alpha/beta fold hydrolase [Phycicoccus sp. Soil802]|uniref:alpha/beta fold hydrolase n=1 Tax=Phycicoccus sp. Soil802 TaxID=1736414 RepID=UPI000A4B51C9|nr:hypothetical protein [Phycicoccus sp. Soil802]
MDPIPSEWGRFLADTIPSADLAILEGASHFPMIEDADLLRDTVVPWLRKYA